MKEGQVAELRLGEHNLETVVITQMSPKTSSPVISILLILGGAVFGALGGLHAIYTLLDLRNPRRLVPVDPSVADAMAKSARRCNRRSGCRVEARICGEHGLALTSATVLGSCCLPRLRSGPELESGCSPVDAPRGIVAALTLIGCVYLVLALRYWFRVPAIGIAIGTGCFALAWALSLR